MKEPVVVFEKSAGRLSLSVLSLALMTTPAIAQAPFDVYDTENGPVRARFLNEGVAPHEIMTTYDEVFHEYTPIHPDTLVPGARVRRNIRYRIWYPGWRPREPEGGESDAFYLQALNEIGPTILYPLLEIKSSGFTECSNCALFSEVGFSLVCEHRDHDESDNMCVLDGLRNLWLRSFGTDSTHPVDRTVVAQRRAWDGAERFPVIIFTHGNFGTGSLASPMAELLTKFGYIVVAPTHVGNSIYERFKLDELLDVKDLEDEYRNLIPDEYRAPWAEILAYRPQDVLQSLNMLDQLRSDHPLHGRADTSNVMVVGHSFGGYTALSAAGTTLDVQALIDGCFEPGLFDENGAPNFRRPWDCAHLHRWAPILDAGFADRSGRIKAIVTQNAGYGAFKPSSWDDIRVPVMIQASMEDNNTGYEKWSGWGLFERLGSANRPSVSDEDVIVSAYHADHNSLMGFCNTFEKAALLGEGGLIPLETLYRQGCNFDTSDPEKRFVDPGLATEVIRHQVLLFAMKHLGCVGSTAGSTIGCAPQSMIDAVLDGRMPLSDVNDPLGHDFATFTRGSMP